MAAGTQPSEPGGSGSETADALSEAPFFQRTDWLSCGITSAVALVVYLWTLAPDVTLEFSGLISTGGVLHPPGYPIWLGLGVIALSNRDCGAVERGQ